MHFSERLDRLTSSLIRELLALTQQPDMISFAGGLPAARAMPPLGLAGVPETLRQYGTTDGEPELRATIARYLTGLGRSCTAEQVLITSGSQQGLDLVSKLFIDPSTTVAVEAPSYLAALQAFRFFGAEFLELPLGAGGLDPQQLRDAIRQRRPAFLYLIPTFQNPSGLCYDEATRAAVAEVLSESGVPLLEDEPYRELVYEPCDRTPICTRLADGAPWMVMGSFSKTGIPGLRIGYIAASSDIHPHLVRIKQCTDLHTNRIGQWWANQFMQSAGYLDHLDRLRDYYRAQRDAMQAGLQRYLADLATWQRPHGGLFFWITLNEAVDERELLQEVLARKVAFMPGGAFYATPPARQGRMRLNFSHSTPEQVDRGLRVLGDTVREHLGRHSRRHATTG